MNKAVSAQLSKVFPARAWWLEQRTVQMNQYRSQSPCDADFNYSATGHQNYRFVLVNLPDGRKPKRSPAVGVATTVYQV